MINTPQKHSMHIHTHFVCLLLLLHLARGSYQVIDLLKSNYNEFNRLHLYPNDFDNDSQSCTDKQIIKATYDGFALPRTFNKLLIHARLTPSPDNCNTPSNYASSIGSGVIFSFGSTVSLALDENKSSLILSAPTLGCKVAYSLPLRVFSNTIAYIDISLVIIPKKDLQLYVNDALIPPDTPIPSALLSFMTSNNDVLYQNGIVLGTTITPSPSTSTTISQYLQSSICAYVVSFFVATDWPDSTNQPPTALELQIESMSLHNVNALMLEISSIRVQPSDDVFIGQEVVITALFNINVVGGSVKDLRSRIIVYGVPPETCKNSSECGNTTFENYYNTTTTTTITSMATATIRFNQSGKFLIRTLLSNGNGIIVHRDTTIIVRKTGDIHRHAPCCRHTPYITAQQLGRPIDRTTFRGSSVYNGAVQLGWIDKKYDLYGVDMESERLFDYSILAPSQPRIPLQTIACTDTRLVGAGSPTIYGLTTNVADVSGHNKALTYVPLAFPWATPSHVECNAHFSHWQDTSPYARMADDGTMCSVGCTRAGTLQLIQLTGAFDQFNQAMISNSYGALSISPSVTVLPEVLVEKSPSTQNDSSSLSSSSPTSYYSTPAKQAIAAQPGSPPWMFIVLSPLAYHQNPPHRAWSAGMSSASAYMTTCFPTMYLSVHETGHRLGFKHSNVYKLNSATTAPSNPIGSGSFVNDAYSDRLDVMSCCKGDYGLYHRTLAGWLYGSGRMFISSSDMQQNNEYKVLLWPFDRSESSKNKERMMSVSIRKSSDEILLLGFRSASHWQESGSGIEIKIQPEEARQNVKGLQVEYLKRNGSVWSQRGLVDFNVLTGDFPDALPLNKGEFPRMSNFALLKEGQSWYDAASKLLIKVEMIQHCPLVSSDGDNDDDSSVVLTNYSYSALNYYGYRGEWPFQENPQRADYRGYMTFDCLSLIIETQAMPPPSQPLQIAIAASSTLSSLSMYQPLYAVNSRKLSSILLQQHQLTQQDLSSCLSTSQNASSQQQQQQQQHSSIISSSYTFTLSWNTSNHAITSLICKDSLNYTIYSLGQSDFISDTSSSSTSIYSNTTTNNNNSVSLDIDSLSLPIRIFALADDGRHAVYIIQQDQQNDNNNNTVIKVTTKQYGIYEHTYSTNILDPMNSMQQTCGGLKQQQGDTAAQVTWLIVGVSVLSCAVLIVVGWWVVWCVRGGLVSRSNRSVCYDNARVVDPKRDEHHFVIAATTNKQHHRTTSRKRTRQLYNL